MEETSTNRKKKRSNRTEDTAGAKAFSEYVKELRKEYNITA